MAVLTLSFTAAFNHGIFRIINNVSDTGFLRNLVITLVASFFAVFTAFVLHEIGHKVAANHYGYPAAFAYSKSGLIFAAFISFFFGFLFAAPGAVIIYGYPDSRENGIISMAGPLVNLLVAIISFGLFIVTVILFSFTGAGSILASIFILVATINTFIGAFNMIPIGILDGAKILRWNKIAYFTLLAFFIPGIILFLLI